MQPSAGNLVWWRCNATCKLHLAAYATESITSRSASENLRNMYKLRKIVTKDSENPALISKKWKSNVKIFLNRKFYLSHEIHNIELKLFAKCYINTKRLYRKQIRVISMAISEITLANVRSESYHRFRVTNLTTYAWWLFNANSITREYASWHSRRAIRHLSYRHVTRSRTRCSNAFLTVASKCTYVSFCRAIFLGSPFHCLLHDGNYTAWSEKPLVKYTSAVCDRGKSKRLFTNSCVSAIITDEKSRYASRHSHALLRTEMKLLRKYLNALSLR